MLPLQRLPSFLRSYWASWTSWLQHTNLHKIHYQSSSSQLDTCKIQGNEYRVLTWTLTGQAVYGFNGVLGYVIGWLVPGKKMEKLNVKMWQINYFYLSLFKIWQYAFATGVVLVCWTVSFLVRGTLSTKEKKTVSSQLSLNLIFYSTWYINRPWQQCKESSLTDTQICLM